MKYKFLLTYTVKKIVLFAGCLLLISDFLLAQNQNVGIGTATPAEKLHVAGNIKGDTVKPNVIKITLNAGSGKLLTSDATGNASWQTNNTSASVNLGYGVWGDCATNGNISEYNPVAETDGGAGDNFGYNVSISGNYAIVGVIADDIGVNINQGSASIYRFNGINWVFMQKLIDVTGAAEDHFGISVSISGNYAIVGSYRDDAGSNIDQGSANIYQYNGNNWILMQKLTDATGAAEDHFGNSVSISGNYAIVGSYADDVGSNVDQGSANIFQYNGSNWVLMQKISDATGEANDNFGVTVSISGNYAIVGAYLDDVGISVNQGSASIFQYNGSNWVLMQKISDATGEANDNFGKSVSISGMYAIAGASNDNSGSNIDQGSASIYQYVGNGWILMQKITDSTTAAANDAFGISVSISGDYAIVGAYWDDIGANTDQGSARIYLRLGKGWQKLQYLTDPSGTPEDYFGISTAIDGNTKRFLIGARGYVGFSGKAVFGKIN